MGPIIQTLYKLTSKMKLTLDSPPGQTCDGIFQKALLNKCEKKFDERIFANDHYGSLFRDITQPIIS